MTNTEPGQATRVLDHPMLSTSKPAATAAHPRMSRVRAWSSSHPLTTFLVLAFGLGYPLMSVPILAGHGIVPGGWLPDLPGVDTERVASALLVLVVLLPAALVTTWVADGPEGLRPLVRLTFRWQFGARWWLLAVAGLPTLTLGLALLLGDTFEPVDTTRFVVAQLVGLLVNLVLINMWEETAWSGVVQTRLEGRHGLAKAALLTAVPFALIHMPLHFIGSFSVGSLVGALVSLLVVCAIVRLMIGVFLRGTAGSILAAALVHTAFNRSNNEEGIVAGLLEGDARELAGLLAVLLMTVAVAAATRHPHGVPTHRGSTLVGKVAGPTAVTSATKDRS